MVRRLDTVLLAIQAAAPDMADTQISPPLAAKARFGLETLTRRCTPPVLDTVLGLTDR
jgi:hypothetical protein